MRNNTSNPGAITGGTPSIFELVERTKKFIRFELVHAGVTVAIFFGIFLVLQPWNYSSGSSEDRPYWMVGLPLIYFMVDLSLALMLHFSMLNELRPKTCKLWMILQVVNLIQLTLSGFLMIWKIKFGDYTFLKLILALLVLYVYKLYRISIMRKLVRDMNARCSITGINGDGGGGGSPNTISTSGLRHNQGMSREQHIFRPSFISVQQPEGTPPSSNIPPPVPVPVGVGGNVKHESSA